jgi:hypothetical protein
MRGKITIYKRRKRMSFKTGKIGPKIELWLLLQVYWLATSTGDKPITSTQKFFASQRGSIEALNTVLEWLGLIKPDVESAVGWTPTVSLIELADRTRKRSKCTRGAPTDADQQCIEKILATVGDRAGHSKIRNVVVTALKCLGLVVATNDAFEVVPTDQLRRLVAERRPEHPFLSSERNGVTSILVPFCESAAIRNGPTAEATARWISEHTTVRNVISLGRAVTDIGGRKNHALDRKVSDLMTGFYFDAKCGQAAAHPNTHSPEELIEGHRSRSTRQSTPPRYFGPVATFPHIVVLPLSAPSSLNGLELPMTNRVNRSLNPTIFPHLFYIKPLSPIALKRTYHSGVTSPA